MAEGHCLVATALGPIGLAWSAAGLVRVRLPERDPEASARRLARLRPLAAPPAAVAVVAERLAAWAQGAAPDFGEAQLDTGGLDDFEARVYARLRRVPWGATTTYGALAAAAGAPGAAREVGRAMARNPWPVVVPCHRVLAAEGRLGGFSGYGGALTKARLLALEGVAVGGTPALPGLFG
jgi:methylated-DNA-[protein]-cysteine S-methyltransferase